MKKFKYIFLVLLVAGISACRKLNIPPKNIIQDPQVFTRPWKISMPLYRRVEKNAQLGEFKCVEYSEELLYGDLRKKK